MSSLSYSSIFGDFVFDPILRFKSWTKTQQIICVSAATLTTMMTFISLKKKYIRSKMRALGYRELDQMSYVNQILQDNNFPLTIFGFEFADSQRLTFEDVKYFAQQFSKHFINFRSEIIPKNGTYYLKESDKLDVNKHLNYIKLCVDDVELMMSDEDIIQHAVEYINTQNLINVKWNSYHQANWDMFYLHYTQYNKCFVFFRCNHVIVDGLFACTCFALLQFHLWGNKDVDANHMHCDLDINRIQSILKHVYAQPKMKKPVWYNMYLLASLIPSFIGIIRNAIAMKPDAICSINRAPAQWTGNFSFALGADIAIKQFKHIANKNGGTVNDFFLLLASKAIKTYMKLNNDTIATNIQHINAVGVKNLRSAQCLERQFVEFCKNGANANTIMYIPYYLPLKTCSMKLIQKRFAKIKYGLSGWWTMHISRLLTFLPVSIITHWVKGAGGASTFVSSNFIASKKALPVPPLKDAHNNNNNKYVTCAFGMSTPASANMNFSVLTYNNYIRLGVCAEIGSVSDTKLMVKCFMDQYKLYVDAYESENENEN